MYFSHEVSERIRKLAHRKGISIKKILDTCELNINTISKKSESGMASFSLAKIADCLDCSVDYLLCRTENPNAHKTHTSDVSISPYTDQQLIDIIDIYKQLDNVGKAKLLVEADRIKNINNLEDNTRNIITSNIAKNSDEIIYCLNEKDSFACETICGIVFEGTRYNVKTWIEAIEKLCELLIDKNMDLFNQVLTRDEFKGHKINYFSGTSNNNKHYKKISNADIYIWANRSADSICSTLNSLLKLYSIPLCNFAVCLKKKSENCGTQEIKSNEEDTTRNAKIGEYVRSTIRKLSDSNYVFTDSMLLKLTSAVETKKIFGIGLQFFKERDKKLTISEQIKDRNGKQNRYWKEEFTFNGHQYLLVSQWGERSRERFDDWLKGLNANI